MQRTKSATSLASQAEKPQLNPTIGITASSFPANPSHLKAGIKNLSDQGFLVQVDDRAFGKKGLFSASDENRAKSLDRLAKDPSIDAIWCARGGYGTVRIIDSLDFTKFKKHPKWIMGFSDVTVLHSHLNVERVATLHSIMPFTVPKAPEEVKETLRKALFGDAISYTIPSKPYDVKGKASGELVGGNISILYSLLGSKSSIDTKGKILFIEDLDEYLYHIDRMMYNLKRNGYFENVKGIIVGSMADMHDNEIPFGQNEVQIITAIAKEYKIPIAFEYPAGHQKDNRTLILGKQVDFEVNDKEVILSFK